MTWGILQVVLFCSAFIFVWTRIKWRNVIPVYARLACVRCILVVLPTGETLWKGSRTSLQQYPVIPLPFDYICNSYCASASLQCSNSWCIYVTYTKGSVLGIMLLDALGSSQTCLTPEAMEQPCKQLLMHAWSLACLPSSWPLWSGLEDAEG